MTVNDYDKRTSKALLLTLFLWLAAPFPVLAQEAHTYVDRDSVQVGDLITYSLVLNKDKAYSSVRYPGEEHFDDDAIQFVNRERHGVTEMRDSVVYRLQFFGVEDTRIPRLDIELTDADSETTTIRSNPVPLFFKTVLAEGDEEFRPLKPIFDFAASFWPWLMALLLLALAAWYLYRYYTTRQEKPEPEPLPEPLPFINPLNTLKEELNALSGDGSPLDDRDFKEFYVKLGDAIRQYFEDAYQIGALEMTSGEILRELRDYPAEREIIVITRKVLNEADMVKFARFEPDVPQAKQALDIAWQFLKVVSDVDSDRIARLREDHEQKQQQNVKVEEVYS